MLAHVRNSLLDVDLRGNPFQLVRLVPVLVNEQFMRIVIDMQVLRVDCDIVPKDKPHFFQWDPLRLWNNEIHKGNTYRCEDDKKKVKFPSNISKCLLNKVRVFLEE